MTPSISKIGLHSIGDRQRAILLALGYLLVLAFLVAMAATDRPVTALMPAPAQASITATPTSTYSAPVGLSITSEGVGLIYYLGLSNLNGAHITFQIDPSLQSNEVVIRYGDRVTLYNALFTPPAPSVSTTPTSSPTTTPIVTATSTPRPTLTRTPTPAPIVTFTSTPMPTLTPTPSATVNAWGYCFVRKMVLEIESDATSNSNQVGTVGYGAFVTIDAERNWFGHIIWPAAGWIDLTYCTVTK